MKPRKTINAQWLKEEVNRRNRETIDVSADVRRGWNSITKQAITEDMLI